jgi:integrase/recombinase XerD
LFRRFIKKKAVGLPIVTVKPLMHLGKPFWKLCFCDNLSLHEYLKQATGVRYSQTYGVLVTHPTKEQYQLLEQYLKGVAILALDEQQAAPLHLSPVTLYPAEGKQVLLRHRYDTQLYRLLKCLPYLKYSKEKGGWLADTARVPIQQVLQDVKRITKVRLDARLEISNIKDVQEAFRGNEKGQPLCPQQYLEVLFSRGYSRNTIKTYHSLLLRFMQELELKDEDTLFARFYHEFNGSQAMKICQVQGPSL